MLYWYIGKRNGIISGSFVKLIISLSLCLCLVNFVYIPANAQSFGEKENNIWLGSGCIGCIPYSGLGSPGLDFNGDTMVTIWGVASTTNMGAGFANGAAICDKEGQLLFYTDGNIVYDRNHDVMVNGWDINNTGQLYPDSTFFINPRMSISARNQDGVVIMPVPGNSHKYYIFCVPQIWVDYRSSSLLSQQWHGVLYCTVVDMELNSGLGGIDPDHRGMVIADSMAGNLHGIVGDNCDIWLLGYSSDGVYKAFRIASSGIDINPVISTLSPPLYPTVYELNVSPGRHKVAMAFNEYVEVSDFDPATGMLSNPVSLGAQSGVNMAFSPNDSFLYVSGLIGIRQYRLHQITDPFTLLTIRNYTGFEYDGPLKLAPNGKIYFTYSSGVGVAQPAYIQFPNRSGTAAQLDTIGPPGVRHPDQPYPLLARYGTFHGDMQLPNESPILLYDTVSARKEVPICFGKPALLQPLPEGSFGTDFHWMINTVHDAPGLFKRVGDCNMAMLEATVPGTYTVQYFTPDCLLHRDTFIVDRVSFSLYLGADTMSCEGQPISLNAGVADAAYLWQDSSTNSRYVAEESGTYWVEVEKDGCSISDSIIIRITDIRQDLGRDTLLCLEDEQPVTLKADIPTGASVLWSNGSTASQITTTDSGLFWVEVRNEHCLGIDSIVIQRQYCDCPILIPTAFSPNNDGKNDEYKPGISGDCPVKDYQLKIYNRWGQLVFVSYKPEQGWDGTYGGKPADVGNYTYHLQMTTGLRGKATVKSGDLLLIR